MPPDTSLEQGVRSMVEAAGKAGPNRGRVRARQLIASHLIGPRLALVRRNAA